jgi:hemoglobin
MSKRASAKSKRVAENPQPDLDTRERIEGFVDAFYSRLLADPVLAPIFLDVAGIDLEVHLPHIKDYWCKLLLGEAAYRRHTMNIHRQLHSKRELEAADFQRWLALFCQTVDERYQGPKTERAKQVAASIANNMQQALVPSL